MESTCKIDGCDHPVKGKGWCQAHYMRWYTTGDVQADVPVVRKPKGRTCSVGGCDRPHVGRGYCGAHLLRFKKYGDAGSAEIEPRRPGAVCSVDGCPRPHAGLGYCDTHLQRFRKRGTVDLPHDRGRRWTGDDATYAAVHIRLRLERGPAKAQTCVTCGAPAQHWAFDHDTADVMYDPRGLPYTTDLDRYQPMCQPCHRRMDADRTRRRGCTVEGCGGAHKARGMCDVHYRRSLAEEKRSGIEGQG